MEHFDAEQRRRLSDRIAEARTRAQARVRGLERDLETIVRDSAESARDDEHDPEGATIAFERAQVIALLGDARDRLEQLDAVERRLAVGEALTCGRCGRTVGFDRLLARPTARTCVPCAGGRPG